MTFIRDQFMAMKQQTTPTKVVVFTNDKELLDEVMDQCPEVPVLVYTNRNPSSAMLMRKTVKVHKLTRPPLTGMDVLRQTKDLILSASVEGSLKEGDKILCVVSTDIDTVLYFDMAHTGITGLRELLEGSVNINVLEKVSSIATQIAREGREGHPAGALFVIGDTDRVLLNSEESIMNPFSNTRDPETTVMNEDNWNTIKNYAVLDGALIVDNEGYCVSAGRYVVLKDVKRLSLMEGLGGRHLAGASISLVTKAVAVVVSTSGVIRIYKGGEEIYKIKAV